MNGSRPHARLLELLRGAIRILPEGTNFRGEHTYIDLLGSTLATPTRAQLSELAGEWISRLERDSVEPVFALLVPKSGNVLLAEAVAALRDPPMALIVAKDQDDKSRISTDKDIVSPVNFEGLTECVSDLDEVTHPKKRIIAFDDSCRNGGTIRKAIEDLNCLIASLPDQYPFELVREIVVLFRRGSPTTEDQLSGGLSLHALLMCDDSVIQRLHRLPGASQSDLDQLAALLLDQNPLPNWLAESRSWHDSVQL